MTPLFVVTGDTHLRPGSWSSRPEIRGDSYEAFRQVVDYCESHHLPLVLVGDILDVKRPDAASVWFLVEQLARLTKLGIPVLLLQGNHDMADQTPWGLLPGGVIWFNEKFLGSENKILPGVSCAGFDYRRAEELQASLASIQEDTQVLFLHQTVDLAMPIEGRHDLKAEWVPEHVKWVFLGDYHVAGSWTSLTGTTFVSPGSTCMQSVDEDPQKSFVVVGQGIHGLEVRREPLRTRPVLRLVARSAEEFESVLQDLPQKLEDLAAPSLPECVRRPILHIRYPSSVATAATRISEVVGDAAHLWAVPDVAIAAREEKAAAEARGISPEEVLATQVDPREEPEVFGLVVELLNAEDPQAVLDAAWSEPVQSTR